MYAASSEARNAWTPAISSGRAMRPIGTRATIFSRITSGTPASMRVMTGPGATQLTVIPYFAYSSARVRVRPITPAFEAA